jgi:hypothetical protein
MRGCKRAWITKKMSGKCRGSAWRWWKSVGDHILFLTGLAAQSRSEPAWGHSNQPSLQARATLSARAPELSCRWAKPSRGNTIQGHFTYFNTYISRSWFAIALGQASGHDPSLQLFKGVVTHCNILFCGHGVPIDDCIYPVIADPRWKPDATPLNSPPRKGPPPIWELATQFFVYHEGAPEMESESDASLDMAPSVEAKG